jgi:dTDP-4-dehydrorhamnose 3,5-epimerase-like enzyme
MVQYFMMNTPSVLSLSTFINSNGVLNVLELPFDVKRIYTISSANAQTIRGAHGHKELKQIFIAISGILTIKLHDGIKETVIRLESPESALYVPNGYWRVLQNFSEDCICLVLASTHYDTNDYIYEFDEYVKWKAKQIQSN